MKLSEELRDQLRALAFGASSEPVDSHHIIAAIRDLEDRLEAAEADVGKLQQSHLTRTANANAFQRGFEAGVAERLRAARIEELEWCLTNMDVRWDPDELLENRIAALKENKQ